MKATKRQLLQVVERLRGRRLSGEEIGRLKALLDARKGNAREVLFQLYDDWEDGTEAKPDRMGLAHSGSGSK